MKRKRNTYNKKLLRLTYPKKKQLDNQEYLEKKEGKVTYTI